MKILVVSYKIPFSLKDGGAYSVYMSVKSLLSQPDCQVKVLAMNPAKDPFFGEIHSEFLAKKMFESVDVDTRLKPLRMIRNLVSKQSDFVERFHSEVFLEKLKSIVEEENFDVIQLEHLYLCTYLNDMRAVFDGEIVLRAQNVEHKLWESYRDNSTNWLRRFYLKLAIPKLKRFEETMIRNVDGVLALTKEDATVFRAIAPQTPIEIVPIAFDHTEIDAYSFTKQFEVKPVVYHLGSMDWQPNIQGVNWFVKEVLPILVRLDPHIEVHLAGKKMPESIVKIASTNLIVDGEVDSALHYIEDKSILIVPLLSGSGIRVKIIEAMALGKSIVSTTLGARGINYSKNKEILIADSPEDFAAAIKRCYDSLAFRQELSFNARELAQNEFGLHQIGRKKMNFYHHLLSTERTSSLL